MMRDNWILFSSRDGWLAVLWARSQTNGVSSIHCSGRRAVERLLHRHDLGLGGMRLTESKDLNFTFWGGIQNGMTRTYLGHLSHLNFDASSARWSLRKTDLVASCAGFRPRFFWNWIAWFFVRPARSMHLCLNYRSDTGTSIPYHNVEVECGEIFCLSILRMSRITLGLEITGRTLNPRGSVIFAASVPISP